MKYDATTDPKWDSISFMRDSHGINWVEKFVSSRRMCCIFCNDTEGRKKKKVSLSI